MTGPLTGISFLIIGASHFATGGYLITTLHSRLQQQGAEVATYGACGVPPGAWVSPRMVECGTASRVGNGPLREEHGKMTINWQVTTLIRQHHPRVVVVGIGDSLGGYVQPELPANWIKEQVHTLVGRITAEGVACVWVGPSWGTEGGPYFKTYARVKALSDLLAAEVAPCAYIDSLALSKPGQWPTFDGQHHTRPGYEAWGQALAREIAALPSVQALKPH